MTEDIKRFTIKKTLTIDVSADDDLSNAVDFRAYAGGMLIMPATWTSANIVYKVCDTANGTFVNVYDKDGTQLTLTSPSASLAYELPPALFAAHYVKIGSSAGQAADRDIVLMLKG